jgi:hypothetical protein
MTRYEAFKSLPIDELAKLLSDMISGDAPWNDWFTNKHCDGCETIVIPAENVKEVLGFEPMNIKETYECAYCEVHDKCKFFPDLDSIPSDEAVCKMWLEIKVD